MMKHLNRFERIQLIAILHKEYNGCEDTLRYISGLSDDRLLEEVRILSKEKEEEIS